jgi:hypothetical protein
MDAVHKATISGGRIKFVDENRFTLDKTRLEGQDIEVIIRKRRTIRSNSQNAYYFSVVVPIISDILGYTSDETHEILKQMFFSKEVMAGTKSVRIATTTKSTTVQWEEKMSAIRAWASAEFKAFIPLPNEVEL